MKKEVDAQRLSFSFFMNSAKIYRIKYIESNIKAVALPMSFYSKLLRSYLDIISYRITGHIICDFSDLDPKKRHLLSYKRIIEDCEKKFGDVKGQDTQTELSLLTKLFHEIKLVLLFEEIPMYLDADILEDNRENKTLEEIEIPPETSIIKKPNDATWYTMYKNRMKNSKVRPAPVAVVPVGVAPVGVDPPPGSPPGGPPPGSPPRLDLVVGGAFLDGSIETAVINLMQSYMFVINHHCQKYPLMASLVKQYERISRHLEAQSLSYAKGEDEFELYAPSLRPEYYNSTLIKTFQEFYKLVVPCLSIKYFEINAAKQPHTNMTKKSGGYDYRQHQNVPSMMFTSRMTRDELTGGDSACSIM